MDEELKVAKKNIIDSIKDDKDKVAISAAVFIVCHIAQSLRMIATK